MNEELQAGHVFDGNLEAAYQTYWNQFADDAELTHLLGLLASIRGVIDFSWIRTWGNDSAIARLGNRFAHYFRIEDTSRWYFFHNSFRLFLVAKTAEFPAGTVNPINDCAYHIELADLCGEDSAQPAQAWEEVYHRAAGDQHDKVLKMATQDYFRNQFLAFRPLGAIQADILVALRSGRHLSRPNCADTPLPYRV